MKCPKCGQPIDYGGEQVKCAGCGSAFDREQLETLGHVDYLLQWLDDHQETLSAHVYRTLRRKALDQRWALASQLGLATPAVRAPAEAVERPAPEPKPVVPEARPQVPVETPGAEIGSRAEMAATWAVMVAARNAVIEWSHEAGITARDLSGLFGYLDREIELLRRQLGRSRPWDAPVSKQEVIAYLGTMLPGWTKARYLTEERARSLADYYSIPAPAQPKAVAAPGAPPAAAPSAPAPLPTPPPAAALQPRPAPAGAAVTAPPRRTPEPSAPAARPKRERPRVDWRAGWGMLVEAAASGALLRGLLYLGAFMIVVSISILVLRFWEQLPVAAQVGYIFSVPAFFYVFGWALRTRLKLPQAGAVFVGIGALLLAVDFAAIYRFGDLAARGVDGSLYWLAAALLCTALYALTAWRLPNEFMGYVAGIGLGNVMVALASTLRLPLPWWATAAGFTGLMLLGLAVRLGPVPARWQTILRAFRRLAVLLLPASQVAVLALQPGEAGWALPADFGVAAAGYALLAWRFPALPWPHAAAWSSVGAIGTALMAAGLPAQWYAAVAALLAAPYMVVSHRLDAPRPPGEAVGHRSSLAPLIAGYGLIGAAALAGLATLRLDLWAAAAALALASAVLAWCAAFRRRPLFVLLAAGLFIVPLSVTAGRGLFDRQAEQWQVWTIAAWTGLALVYLGMGVRLRRAEQYAAPLYAWAHVLAPLALFCLLAVTGTAGLLIGQAAAGDTTLFGLGTVEPGVPGLVALAGVIGIYAASAAIHGSGRHPALSRYAGKLPGTLAQDVFLWPVSALLPLWVAGVWIVAGWPVPWLGAALAAPAL
jgi:hypothetical protein